MVLLITSSGNSRTRDFTLYEVNPMYSLNRSHTSSTPTLRYLIENGHAILRSFANVQTPNLSILQPSNCSPAPPSITKSPCKGQAPSLPSRTPMLGPWTSWNIPMLLLRLEPTYLNSAIATKLSRSCSKTILKKPMAAPGHVVSFWLASQPPFRPPYSIGLNVVTGFSK